MALFLVPVQDGVLEITKDIQLDPEKTYGPLVIKASGVTIDGRGAWVIGVKKGVGISADGVKNVTLKNVNVKHFETGLKIDNGEGWTIEGCDFSDNFHDPSFGWGENGRRGGMALTNVTKSAIRKNKANRVWDACNMERCHDNTIEENDFSKTSNTCLKFWTCCRNTVRKNNLSYGIRISPGEVHARDSTSVLIESGSNHNTFVDNDASHGGDGIFIRVLNGWTSTHNYFEGNDVSYANNNGFEAWSPYNTYVRNKANHCSYGFWLGASDKTVLIENEASHNGDPKGLHNSPHLPNAGHAGIVFMFGPSSHTIARGNRCHDNNGAGIALIGDDGKKWKAFHWILEKNDLRRNRWGIYMKNADWIDLAANVFEKNSIANIQNDGGVTNLFERTGEVKDPPKAVLKGPSSVRVGKAVTFDASESRAASFRWDLGDGTISTDAKFTHAYAKPGFYRLGLTVNNGLYSDLAYGDIYAVEDGDLAGEWDFDDPKSTVTFAVDRETFIAGADSMRAHVNPYSGGRVNLLFPKTRKAGWSVKDKDVLVFWLKTINTNIPSWQDANPIVTLYESDDKFARLTPAGDVVGNPPYIEARDGWLYVAVPLAGSKLWKRKGDIETINYVSIGFDSWGYGALTFWIDGLAFDRDRHY
jgi:parallel beta-helix repeat protein